GRRRGGRRHQATGRHLHRRPNRCRPRRRGALGGRSALYAEICGPEADARGGPRAAGYLKGVGSTELHEQELSGDACNSAAGRMAAQGLVSRVTPVHTAMRNCTRDEGRSFEVGNQVLISSHRKLLWSKAMVVNVAEKSGQD